jgi:hypothetical protein
VLDHSAIQTSYKGCKWAFTLPKVRFPPSILKLGKTSSQLLKPFILPPCSFEGGFIFIFFIYFG